MALFVLVWTFSTYNEPIFDLREHPDTIEAFVKGSILKEANQFETVIEAFNNAVATVPDYSAAYIGRSGVYENVVNYEAAIMDLK